MTTSLEHLVAHDIQGNVAGLAAANEAALKAVTKAKIPLFWLVPETQMLLHPMTHANVYIRLLDKGAWVSCTDTADVGAQEARPDRICT